MRRKVYDYHLSYELEHAFRISVAMFDSIVDKGFDDILVITPHHRYLVALDDILDYGHVEDEVGIDFYVISKAYVGLV